MNSIQAITLRLYSLTIHLKRIIIAKILMTLSAVRTYVGSGSFTARGSNPITAASFCSCSSLNIRQSGISNDYSNFNVKLTHRFHLRKSSDTLILFTLKIDLRSVLIILGIMSLDVAGSIASPFSVTLNPTNVKEILSWLKNKYGWKLHKESSI